MHLKLFLYWWNLFLNKLVSWYSFAWVTALLQILSWRKRMNLLLKCCRFPYYSHICMCNEEQKDSYRRQKMSSLIISSCEKCFGLVSSGEHICAQFFPPKNMIFKQLDRKCQTVPNTLNHNKDLCSARFRQNFVMQIARLYLHALYRLVLFL